MFLSPFTYHILALFSLKAPSAHKEPSAAPLSTHETSFLSSYDLLEVT